jgi:hypothetical protein
MADEKELKDQRVPIMMTPSELEAIDDWMFKNRIRSRGEAIRRLCQIGLATDTNVGDMGRSINALLDAVYNMGSILEQEIEHDRLPVSAGQRAPEILREAIDATFQVLDAHSAVFVEVAPMKSAELTFDEARDEALRWRNRIAEMTEKSARRRTGEQTSPSDDKSDE